MNRICDDLNPGLETQENENDTNLPTSDEEIKLRDTDMPPPFNLVPIAPSPPARAPSQTTTTTTMQT